MPRTRKILVLAVGGCQSLDVLGPVEVFDYAARQGPGAYEIEVVGPSTSVAMTIRNRVGLMVSPLPE